MIMSLLFVIGENPSGGAIQSLPDGRIRSGIESVAFGCKIAISEAEVTSHRATLDSALSEGNYTLLRTQTLELNIREARCLMLAEAYVPRLNLEVYFAGIYGMAQLKSRGLVPGGGVHILPLGGMLPNPETQAKLLYEPKGFMDITNRLCAAGGNA